MWKITVLKGTSYILIHLPRFLSDVYASLVYLRSCIWIVSNFLISCVSCACDVYILDVHTRQIIPQTTDVALSHVSHLQLGGRPLWKTICSALSRLVTCNYIYRRNMCMSIYICILHVFSIWQLYIYIYIHEKYIDCDCQYIWHTSDMYNYFNMSSRVPNEFGGIFANLAI